MKAMVFAAGFGSRLKAITETLPKCLVEVAGKTMLEHVVDRLKVAGVSEIVINLHYRGEQIRSYVTSRNSFGITVHFSDESEILGTGGGLKKAARYFEGEDCFIVHNSDVYSDVDLGSMVAAHRKAAAVATLGVMSRPSDRVLLFDESGDLLGYQNKKEGNRSVVRESAAQTGLGFSGIQVCSPSVFDFMEDETGQFSTIRIFMKAAKAGKAVRLFRMDDSYWIDMGTPERLEELRRRLTGTTA